jgi:hypothetical protein
MLIHFFLGIGGFMLGQQEDNSVLEFGASHRQCTVPALNQRFRYAFFVFDFLY